MVAMRQQNGYRVINEDIAALRNIAWAMMYKTAGSDKHNQVCLIYVVAELLLSPNDKTAEGIKHLLES
jgi:hypothetical protein